MVPHFGVGKSVVSFEPVISIRTEVMHGHDSVNGGGKRGRNLRIAHVGDVRLAADHQVVDFGVERVANLACASREINDHTVGINMIHAEALGLEPGCDGVDVQLRDAVLISLFDSAKPVTEVRRRFVGE